MQGLCCPTLMTRVSTCMCTARAVHCWTPPVVTLQSCAGKLPVPMAAIRYRRPMICSRTECPGNQIRSSTVTVSRSPSRLGTTCHRSPSASLACSTAIATHRSTGTGELSLLQLDLHLQEAVWQRTLNNHSKQSTGQPSMHVCLVM